MIENKDKLSIGAKQYTNKKKVKKTNRFKDGFTEIMTKRQTKRDRTEEKEKVCHISQQELFDFNCKSCVKTMTYIKNCIHISDESFIIKL